jgi:hypothetical protein
LQRFRRDCLPPPAAGTKRLTLDLPEPLYRAIKKNAAEEGVTRIRPAPEKHMTQDSKKDASNP